MLASHSYNDTPKRPPMSSLIIALTPARADASTPLDYVQTGDGVHVLAHGSAPLALLPGLSDRQTELVVVVPVQALSWHRLQLPKGSLPRGWLAQQGLSRLRSILDGLLEEQLLDEPSQLHLALQPEPGLGAPVWVAACDRAWLKAHLAVLAQSGHAVARIVPEFSPEMLGQTLYVLGDEQQPSLVALMGTVATPGLLACPLSTAALALLGDQGGEPIGSRSVLAEPAVAALAEALLARPVSLLQRHQRWLQAAQSTWDLSQFDLQNTRRQRRWAGLTQLTRSLLQAPQWRAARWAVLAVLLVNLIGLNAWAWREQASLQAKRQTLHTLLTSTFPKVPVVVDAPVQMAREVQALQRASGAAVRSDLDVMLASFSAVAPTGYALKAIDFAAQELRIKGPSLSPAELARLVLVLKQQGYAASHDGVQWLLKPGVAP